MTEEYVEFHARSAFSFLDGASLPETLVEQAAQLGMRALGIIDRDGLYGAPRLYTTAKKLGLRSHVGAEVSVSGSWLAGATGRVATAYDSSKTGTAELALRIADRLSQPLAAHHWLQAQTEDKG